MRNRPVLPISASYTVRHIISGAYGGLNISNFPRREQRKSGITHQSAMTFAAPSRIQSANDSILAKRALVLALVRALTLLLLVLGVAVSIGGAGT